MKKKEFPVVPVIGGGIIGIVILLIVAIAVPLYRKAQEQAQVEETYKICLQAAKECKRLDSEIQATDVWGNDLKCDITRTEVCISYTVSSAGRDGEFGTDDDICATQNDLNKSRIVGEWVGNRATEVFKGLKDGLKKKSKFE